MQGLRANPVFQRLPQTRWARPALGALGLLFAGALLLSVVRVFQRFNSPKSKRRRTVDLNKVLISTLCYNTLICMLERANDSITILRSVCLCIHRSLGSSVGCTPRSRRLAVALVHHSLSHSTKPVRADAPTLCCRCLKYAEIRQYRIMV